MVELAGTAATSGPDGEPGSVRGWTVARAITEREGPAPGSACSAVDLPAPLGPTTPMSSGGTTGAADMGTAADPVGFTILAAAEATSFELVP